MAGFLKKLIDVCFTRTQKVQKASSLVMASLADTEKRDIVADSFFRTGPPNRPPKLGYCLDGMLRVIVIPRNAIVLQKCEKLVTILFKTSFPFRSYVRPVVPFGQSLVELLN